MKMELNILNDLPQKSREKIIAAKPHYDDEIVNAFFEESDFLIDR